MTDNSIHSSLNDPVVAHNLGNDPSPDGDEDDPGGSGSGISIPEAEPEFLP